MTQKRGTFFKIERKNAVSSAIIVNIVAGRPSRWERGPVATGRPHRRRARTRRSAPPTSRRTRVRHTATHRAAPLFDLLFVVHLIRDR